MYHQVTGDEAVADSIVKGAEFLIKDMWVPQDSAFRYTSCPKSSNGRGAKGLNSCILEGISYAYRLSGKELFKDIVLKGIKAWTESLGAGVPPIGKAISSQTRIAPQVLYDIENYMMSKD